MTPFGDVVAEYVANFNTFSIGKHQFETEHGSLIFIKDRSNDIIIFEVFIRPELRNRGIFTLFLSNLIDYMESMNLKVLRIVSVLSKVLYEFLERWTYKGKKWNNTRVGFYYICC